ncbi:MAG: hypothetical protein HRU09_14795 [Oligoflexales bacterium]|nr:hypothetical protein [Oligoflexales bacterium]
MIRTIFIISFCCSFKSVFAEKITIETILESAVRNSKYSSLVNSSIALEKAKKSEVSQQWHPKLSGTLSKYYEHPTDREQSLNFSIEQESPFGTYLKLSTSQMLETKDGTTSDKLR